MTFRIIHRSRFEKLRTRSKVARQRFIRFLKNVRLTSQRVVESLRTWTRESRRSSRSYLKNLRPALNRLVATLRARRREIFRPLRPILKDLEPPLIRLGESVQRKSRELLHDLRKLTQKARQVQGRQRMVAGAAVAVLFLIVLALIIRVKAPVPTEIYEQALVAVSRARHQEAASYAPEVMQQAEFYLERARAAWHAENQKWFWHRDFQATHQFAESARLCASIAGTVSAARRDSLELLTTFGIARLQQTVADFREQARRIPVNKALWQKFVASELIVIESKFAHWRRDYLTAKEKLQAAEPLVNGAWSSTKATLEAYLRQVPIWQRWVNETIAWSAERDSVAIIVDKMAHRCYVYADGQLRAEYPVELGPRWLGHKRQRGDNATPEGRYRVIKKKADKQTVYYKALQINYPNDEDRQRFGEAQKRGELSRYATIGGLIEIHGEGGRGANWTAGCVALENRYMDEIYEWAMVGTPITIVGSLKGLPTNGHRIRSSD